MLVFDPSKRLSVDEALKHPFLSTLYDPEADEKENDFFANYVCSCGVKPGSADACTTVNDPNTAASFY